MANINMRQTIKNLDGSAIPELATEETRIARQSDPQAKDITHPLTLGSLCTNALLINTDANMKLNGTDKVRAFNLAKMIHDSMAASQSGEVELDIGELSHLKELIETNFTVIVVGQAVAMLENSAIETMIQ